MYDRRPYFKVHTTCMSIGMIWRDPPRICYIRSVNCSLHSACTFPRRTTHACGGVAAKYIMQANHMQHIYYSSAVAAVRQGKTLNWCTPQTCKLASTSYTFLMLCKYNHSALCYRQLNYMCQCIAPFDRHNKFNPASICIYGNKMFCSVTVVFDFYSPTKLKSRSLIRKINWKLIICT